MESMLFLIPATIGLVTLALWIFIWSVKNDQFEDLDRQAYSILFDKDEIPASPAQEKKSSNDADDNPASKAATEKRSSC